MGKSYNTDRYGKYRKPEKKKGHKNHGHKPFEADQDNTKFNPNQLPLDVSNINDLPEE